MSQHGYESYSQGAERKLGPIAGGLHALGTAGWVAAGGVTCLLIDPLATVRLAWRCSHELTVLFAFLLFRAVLVAGQNWRNRG